jgi:guanylate kinase
MRNALEQLEHAGEYTYVVVNDHKETMLVEVESIVRVELISARRQDNLAFARKLISQYGK